MIINFMRAVAVQCLCALLLPLSAFAQQTERQYLSGHDKDDAIDWSFFCTSGQKSGYWSTIPVPSNWEMKGFGTLSYQYDPANAPVEQGRYRCGFTLPSNWSNRRLFLVFNGVMTDTHASLNGKLLEPVHYGGFYQFKY